MLGDITVSYPILPFGIAVISWAEADISRTQRLKPVWAKFLLPQPSTNSSTVMNYSLSPFLFPISLPISPSPRCRVFNLSDWRQASHGYLIIRFISLSARFCIHMSVFFFFFPQFDSVGIIDTSKGSWLNIDEQLVQIITSSSCYRNNCVAVYQHFKVYKPRNIQQ